MKKKKKGNGSTKPNITQQKKKLWKYFSAYVRARDGYRCFTCDRFATGAGMHAGHFITNSVGGLTLRYDEDNVHAQCYHCNINLSGNWVVYRERMVEKHGEEFVKNLEQRRHEITKDFNYEEKIQEYEAKCEALGVTVR
jgi:hypothetical protein